MVLRFWKPHFFLVRGLSRAQDKMSIDTLSLPALLSNCSENYQTEKAVAEQKWLPSHTQERMTKRIFLLLGIGDY